MVLSYAGRTLGISRALPTELALPQASLSLPPASHSRTCPLPPGIPSGLSSCQGHPGHRSCQPGRSGWGRGPCSAQASPLRLQLRLLFQQHRVPFQPLPAHLLAGVPEELRASSALLLDEHFPVLPQMAGRVRGAGRGLRSRARPPARACPEAGLTQCPVSRARTSSPEVIFPEIWLMLVLPPKKGCGDMPEMDAGEGTELGSRRGSFLVGVRAPSPGAQQGRPHSPAAQPEVQGAGPRQTLVPRGGDGPWPLLALLCGLRAAPSPLCTPHSPGCATGRPGAAHRMPLLRKPSLGTERVVGDPPRPCLSPARAPHPPKPWGG